MQAHGCWLVLDSFEFPAWRVAYPQSGKAHAHGPPGLPGSARGGPARCLGACMFDQRAVFIVDIPRRGELKPGLLWVRFEIVCQGGQCPDSTHRLGAWHDTPQAVCARSGHHPLSHSRPAARLRRTSGLGRERGQLAGAGYSRAEHPSLCALVGPSRSDYWLCSHPQSFGSEKDPYKQPSRTPSLNGPGY